MNSNWSTNKVNKILGCLYCKSNHIEENVFEEDMQLDTMEAEKLNAVVILSKKMLKQGNGIECWIERKDENSYPLLKYRIILR